MSFAGKFPELVNSFVDAEITINGVTFTHFMVFPSEIYKNCLSKQRTLEVIEELKTEAGTKAELFLLEVLTKRLNLHV